MTQDEINARYDVLLEELIFNGDIDANTSVEETAAIMRSVYPCSDEQWYYYAAYCAVGPEKGAHPMIHYYLLDLSDGFTIALRSGMPEDIIRTQVYKNIKPNVSVLLLGSIGFNVAEQDDIGTLLSVRLYDCHGERAPEPLRELLEKFALQISANYADNAGFPLWTKWKVSDMPSQVRQQYNHIKEIANVIPWMGHGGSERIQ